MNGHHAIVHRVFRRDLLVGTALAALIAGMPLAAAAENSSEAEFVVDEIIVTAQKRSENIQTVPASVSVLGGDRIAELNAASLTDYAAYLPGFSTNSNGSPGQVQITIRGISPVGPGATVGTYIDDTPLGSSSNYARAGDFALDLFPYDIERVEVVRGPQGTLYGASTMGGLLKYVTRDPSLSEIKVRAGGDISTTDKASDPNWGLRAQANLPVVSDKLGVQVSAFYQKSAGYVDNLVSGKEDVNRSDQKGARVAALLQINDNATLKLSGMFQKIDSDNNANVAVNPLDGNRFGGSRDSRFFVDEPFSKKLNFYSATLNWDLDWANFTSATSYSKTDTLAVADATEQFGILFPLFTGGAVAPGLSGFDTRLELDKVTHEFRLTSPSGGRLEWMVGTFYTREKSDQKQVVTAADFDGNSLPGLDPLVDVSLDTKYKEIAAFGNVTAKISDRFDVTAGLRWARNNQDYLQINSGPLLGGDAEVPGQSSESVVTFMISPRLLLTDDVTLYGRVASGYRPGGPNAGLPNVPPSVDADTLVNYEAGIKSQWLDGRILANLTAFLIDWKDIQLVSQTGGVGFLANGGSAQSKGIELETAVIPLEGLRIGFNAAYTNARFKEDVPSIGARDGDRLQSVPELTFSATTDYSVSVGNDWTAVFGAGYRWTGAKYSAAQSSDQSVRIPSFGVLDFHAGVNKDWISARLFVRNAANSRAYTAATKIFNAFNQPYQINNVLLQPRTIGLSLDITY